MESNPDCGEVELKDTNADAFHHLLRYIYTARMNLIELKVNMTVLVEKLIMSMTVR